MSKLDIKIEAETNLTDIFASCDDGECGHDDSCSSDDSDSHCCTCCNCNCGKQKMKKELLRQRLRKKLKLRKLRQTATNGDIDVNLQRARKLLLQRLQYPRKKHKSIQPQFPTSFIIEDSQIELRMILGDPDESEAYTDPINESSKLVHDDIYELKRSLRTKSEHLINQFIITNTPTSTVPSSPLIETETASGTDSDEDVNYIFEPRNLKCLHKLDPIEKEIEEFKLFCKCCVPVHPRLKVPLVSLNLFPCCPVTNR